MLNIDNIYVWPSSEAVREKVHKKKFSSYLEMRVRLLEAGELETRRKEHDKCIAYNNALLKNRYYEDKQVVKIPQGEEQSPMRFL